MSGPTDRELLNRLIEAIKPLAFSAAENPPPGIDPDDWHHAIAAWNTRSESDGERVREAEDRGYKRAAKMIAALVADAMIYEDSYGVVGSEFPCCMACNAGGAPGINFTHQANCVVLKCETIADDLWQEQRDELNFVNEENERLRAELAALKGASHDQSRATGSAGAAL